jgi:aminopeptidase N
MKELLCLLLLAASQSVQAAMPHLNLRVNLDPQTRAFSARADLTTTAPLELSLNPLFKLGRVTLNGVARDPAQAAPRPAQGTQHWGVEYSGTLPGLPSGDQRNSPNPGTLYASAQGSYLSPAAGWYPDPGVPFTYRVTLSLPAGQKALAPGNQVRLDEGPRGFIAEYEFPHPAEGVWLMAGPYEVAQQSFTLEGGKPVTVRTWFHPELASLAGGYLQDSGRYLQRYSRLIGDYPFQDFSIVASPMSHGLGMPSLTYLGRDVLRLPFIRATSLGHEVLHNWWGNGVHADWSRGNWSEGLTTFMADYAYREDQSEASAREMRLNWLRDLAAVAPQDETSLADFRARHHGISSVVGYGKAAMVFLMLRDEIGRPAFDEGIRLFWQRHRFRTAGWKDLEAAFAHTSGRDLSAFFAQWVHRAASPRLTLAPASRPGGGARILQQRDVFDLRVPLRVRLASGEDRELAVRARDKETPIDLAEASLRSAARTVELDPDLRLWRRLDPATVPPIFRDVFISPRAALFVANEDPQWRDPAMSLAHRLLDASPVQLKPSELAASPQSPVLVIGDAAAIERLHPELGVAALPEVLAQGPASAGAARRPKGSARAWTARAASGTTYAFVTADTPEALAGMQRSLPHYGRQSWLVFRDGRVAEQGSWPVPPQTLSLDAR